jgi:hypothetical protein
MFTFIEALIVGNKPSAATMIGMEAAAAATPDDYTSVMGSTTTLSVVPHAYSKVPYKILVNLASSLHSAQSHQLEQICHTNREHDSCSLWCSNKLATNRFASCGR